MKHRPYVPAALAMGGAIAGTAAYAGNNFISCVKRTKGGSIMSLDSALLLVYLAGVSQGLGIVLGVATFLFVIASIISAFCWAANSATYEAEDRALAGRVLKRVLPAALICGLLFCVVPTPTFLYLVAGLRVGQEAINTDLGQKAVNLLEQKLDEALAGEKAE